MPKESIPISCKLVGKKIIKFAVYNMIKSRISSTTWNVDNSDDIMYMYI